MKTLKTPSAATQTHAAKLLTAHGAREAQRKTGVHYTSIQRVARGEPATEKTLKALAVEVKEAADFKAGGKALVAPAAKKPSMAWPLTAVRTARDAQLAGNFAAAVPLATAMKVDDAIHVAHFARLAPIRSLETVIKPAVAGKSVAERFEKAVNIPRKTLVSIAGTMVMHGVAFGRVDQVPDDDGSTVRFEIKEWPIANVKWDAAREVYTTKVKDGPDVDITHGDGYWIQFSTFDYLPHQQEACLIPGSLIFAAHVDTIRSWNASADSHGQSKVVGVLPEGVPLQDGDEDTLSPEGESVLATITDLVSGAAGAGIVPFGTEVDYISDGSTAWQVFSELALNREKAAARVWLGTDGILGSQGGAPGVDISQLFGVALTKIQGTCDAISEAIYTGVSVPWTAINVGDSSKAPTFEFLIPDADADQQREQEAKASESMFDEIKRYKEAGFILDQDTVDAIAAKYGCEPPQLAPTEETAPSIVLAPTDVAKVVLVREARLANGLSLLNDFRDDMTIDELTAYNESKKSEAAQQPGTPAEAPAETPTEPPPEPTKLSADGIERASDGRFGRVPGQHNGPKDEPKGERSKGVLKSITSEPGADKKAREVLGDVDVNDAKVVHALVGAPSRDVTSHIADDASVNGELSFSVTSKSSDAKFHTERAFTREPDGSRVAHHGTTEIYDDDDKPDLKATKELVSREIEQYRSMGLDRAEASVNPVTAQVYHEEGFEMLTSGEHKSQPRKLQKAWDRYSEKKGLPKTQIGSVADVFANDNGPAFFASRFAPELDMVKPLK